jgi:hypothetical protein
MNMKNVFILDKKIIITLIFIITLMSNVVAQDDIKDKQTWFDFRTYYTIDQKWTYDGDYGLRGFISNEDWRRVYLNPAFVYDANADIDLRGGMRFIYTREKNATNTIEIRPWQGIRFLWPRTTFVIFSQYIRLEERFTWGTEDGSFDFVVRARYRLMVKTPNLKLVAIDQTFYFLTSLEIFGNVGAAIEETFVDRTRLTFGMGYFITQSWRAELHYVLQGSNFGAGGGENIDVRVFRLRIRYYINYLFQ